MSLLGPDPDNLTYTDYMNGDGGLGMRIYAWVGSLVLVFLIALALFVVASP